MVNKILLAFTLAAAMPLSALTLEECPSTPGVEICDNGIDDDGNGFTDCSDFACVSDDMCEGNPLTCTDGDDNDGDGFIDCEDYSCSQNCETADLCGSSEATVETCSDGLDNDLDGFIDCDDFDCSRNTCDAVRALCADPGKGPEPQ